MGNVLELRVTKILDGMDDRLIAAYLFGSTGRGTAGSRSDIDLGILLRSAGPGRLGDLRFRLEGELESTLGRRADVIVLNEAPVDLVHRVLRDGRLLLDREPAMRIRFEVQARNEYFDLLPFLERYRRATEGISP